MGEGVASGADALATAGGAVSVGRGLGVHVGQGRRVLAVVQGRGVGRGMSGGRVGTEGGVAAEKRPVGPGWSRGWAGENRGR